LSYKKVANKVLLATQEIDALKSEFDLLNQEPVQTTRERVVESSRSIQTSAPKTERLSE
jgi:hypothetical protein